MDIEATAKNHAVAGSTNSDAAVTLAWKVSGCGRIA